MNKTLEEIFADFTQYLGQHGFDARPENLYQPMQYIMELGGKRTRPMLTISACVAAGGSPEIAFPVALAMEQFHNFTLVHDDIMDNALLRRGKATVHAKWDTPTAILSGDNLLVSTYAILCELNLKKKQEILQLFNKTAREVCEGQQMDMDFASQQFVSLSEYMEMIKLKTAVLLGCSAACGAMCANADAERVQLYYQFALSKGLAFQLKDDYLDTFGDSKKTGKTTGGDIIEGKKTWLYIAAEQAGSPISELYSTEDSAKKIETVTATFRALELDKQLLEHCAFYENEAKTSLDKLSALGEKTALLLALGQMLEQREN